MKVRFSKVAALIAFCTLFALPLFANGAAGAAAAVSSTAVAAVVAGGVAAAKSLKKDDGTEFEETEKEFLIAVGKIVDQVGAGMMEKDIAELEIKELKAANAQIQEDLTKAIGALHKQAQKGFSVGTLKEAMKEANAQSLLEAFYGATDKETAEKVSAFKSGSMGNSFVTIGVVKASGTMTTANISSGGVFGVVSSEIEAGITNLRRNPPKLYDAIRKAFTNSAVIKYIEKKVPFGAAAMTAEGAVKPLIDFDLQSTDSTARKVPARIKVSEEMLDDVAFIASEIDNELRFQVYRALSTQIRSGNGVAPNLNGLTTIGAAYPLTTIKTTTPNNQDAINAVVQYGKSINFNYDTIVVNPIDYANMALAKGSDGQYVMVNGVLNGRILVIEDNDQTVGSFIAFDSSVVNFRIYKDFTIMMGLDADDFSKNMRTIIAEMRVHMYVKSNDALGICDDTFALVKTALT